MTKFILILIFHISVSCLNLQGQTPTSWSVGYQGIGTFSSPRISDLNQDGIGDIILGAGREEFHHCDSAVVAINGKNGELLWAVSAIDQVFGSASLLDINNDGVQDIVIGGRSAELIAINGSSGEVMWRFDKNSRGQKWYNFYNPQFINDIDDDGIRDILISNGGDVMVEPYDPNRPAGNLMVISSKNGSLIANAKMPDGKEIYMSISAIPIDNGNDYRIVFGTGGETIGGNLFVAHLSDVLNEDLSDAIKLDSSPDKGYIGPPVWIDITGDAYPDIIVNAVEGKLLAFNGRDLNPVWQVKVPNTEAYSSIAPGYFTDSTSIDFFVSYATGIWPNLEWSKQILVEGNSGKILYQDSLGHYQTSTPVVADLDNDGLDEAIMSVNIHTINEIQLTTLQNMLVVLDFDTKEVIRISPTYQGNNISSTPWIGDMDGDGMFDIVYCHGTNLYKAYVFDGMQINRLKTSIPISKYIPWGSYMGSEYNGIYSVDKK